MKTYLKLSLLALVLSFSCSSNDDSLTKPNEAPVFSDENFIIEVNENPSQDLLLALVATDPEDDALTFSIISQTPQNAISINSANGQIVIATASEFDFEKNNEITAEIKVSDGNLEDTATLTIHIIDVVGPSGGLVAYYPFEAGSANDVSGNTNNGTLLGSVTMNANRFGKSNSAFEFAGGRIRIPTFQLDSETNPIFSISFWVQSTQTTTANQSIIAKQEDDGVSTKRSLNKMGSNVDFSLKKYINNRLALTDENATTTIFGPDTEMTLNQWHHFVITMLNGDFFLYVDGVYQYNDSAVLLNWGPNYNLFIGGISNGNQQEAFIGKIDDVLIYNRVLTAQEVSDIYSNTY